MTKTDQKTLMPFVRIFDPENGSVNFLQMTLDKSGCGMKIRISEENGCEISGSWWTSRVSFGSLEEASMYAESLGLDPVEVMIEGGPDPP